LKFNLKGIYLTSEYYGQNTIDLLRSVFNCDVFGQYGHSEVSVFAVTKANDLEYICSPFYGYVEILNENGSHVSEGETGEVVVTGFSNKIMPFIRYMTGDLAIYGGRRNGIVYIKKLIGRTVDFIYNKNYEKIFLIGLIFGAHMKAFNNIITWQIIQEVAGIININIVKDTLFSNEDEVEIKEIFNSVDIVSNFLYVSSIPFTNNGKRKFLIQLIKK
jgi:phenylacetate-CoA ligase